MLFSLSLSLGLSFSLSLLSLSSPCHLSLFVNPLSLVSLYTPLSFYTHTYAHHYFTSLSLSPSSCLLFLTSFHLLSVYLVSSCLSFFTLFVSLFHGTCVFASHSVLCVIRKDTSILSYFCYLSSLFSLCSFSFIPRAPCATKLQIKLPSTSSYTRIHKQMQRETTCTHTFKQT